MGFGATDPIVWLLGALAMIAIWGGVWWGLSALVFHWPARERTGRGRLPQPSRPESQRWLQPTFDPTGTGPGGPHGAPQPATSNRPQQPPSAESDNR